MPYIGSAIRRSRLDSSIAPYLHYVDGTQNMLNAGELVYVLTRIIERYRKDHGDKFQTFNDIDGALNKTNLEFQRRVVDPYEDEKLQANGDVYAPRA